MRICVCKSSCISVFLSRTSNKIDFSIFFLSDPYTVEPRFTGPRFAGEPRFARQDPDDQTFHYISLLQKPRFTEHKTPILGIFFPKKVRKMS